MLQLITQLLKIITRMKSLIEKHFFLSYGTNNEHSKTFMNYYLFHRGGPFNIDEKIKNEFSENLKTKKIYIDPPKEKVNIFGAAT